MACAAAIASGAAILHGHRLAGAGALPANGVFVCSAINSSGCLLHNEPAVAILTGAALVAPAASTWALLGRRATVQNRVA